MTRLRVVVFSLMLMVPFLVLEARVFQMQVLETEEFTSRADWTRSWVEIVPTPRGVITDRNGEVLAAEERCFDLELSFADFEKPRVKGRDPEIDYDRVAAMLRDLLALRDARQGFDVRQCAAMLKERVYPVRPVTATDPATGKTETWTAPDAAAIHGMLGVAGSEHRRLAGDMYVACVRALRQIDRVVYKRCTVPGKPASARDRRNVVRQEWRQPYPLCQGLTYDQTAEVALDEGRFPGIEIRQRTRRIYPCGRIACHEVGYVQQPGRDQAYAKREAEGEFRGELGLAVDEADEARLRERGWFRDELRGKLTAEEYERLEARDAFSRDWTGIVGIERMYDAELAGFRGIERRARHLLSRKEWVVERVAPVPGKDIRLTLDIRVQKRAEDLLDNLPLGLKGSIVLMDVETGELLALASSPGYDLNWWLRPRTDDETAYLNDPTLLAQFNRAIGGLYPLGSIFKSVTAAAALESGSMTLADTVVCQGRYDPVKYPNKFACWIAAHHGAHGELDLRGAMARSCNCFFFAAGERAGIDRVGETAALFGLGRVSGLDVFGERAGQIPGPAWRRAAGGGRWGFADTLNVSIGQGEILVTPLQAARLMSGFATGRLPVPRLRADAPARFEEIPLTPATLASIRAGLEAVTQESFGTGHSSGLHLFRAAGKTSTAQSSSRQKGLEHHGWFAGYAPSDKPRYAFCVMVEHGGAGSGVPAKTATRLLSAVWPDVVLPADLAGPILPSAHDDTGPRPVPAQPEIGPEESPVEPALPTDPVPDPGREGGR